MSGSKHFDKIAWTVTVLMLVVVILFMNGGTLGLEIMAHTMGYENRLFDNTKVHTIDIVMDDWDEFIDNATSEEYYTAAVVIDGETYKNVGIRGKGNTSLSTVESMDSDRYSFKVEFDHYDDSKTYYGLDKLSLNNLIQDSTMMKDYLTYTMMNEFGVAAPLCSFVYITVNGDDWGLYLAVEGVEESFLERNYGSDYGELYKPDSMSFGGGRGNGKNFDMGNFTNSQESSDNTDNSKQDPSFGGSGDLSSSIDEESLRSAFKKLGIDESLLDGVDFENITIKTIQSVLSSLDEETMQALMQEIMNSGSFEMPDTGRFGSMGSSDVKLQYIDDNASSYSNIWDNAKTDITAADQTRLIESLKKLSNGEQIESVVDVEQVIRYFVVHNYVCNGDSYTGSMVHNYYLYEEDGQMTMIPWDYNLAFGTFTGESGQSTVNTPIDAPISGGSGEDRPMWNWILSSEAYTDLYHQYFSEFLSTVDVQSIIDSAYNLIKSYVKKDPTAFYTYDEFETGVDTLRQFCTLRSESISLQIANGETTSDMSYVDASDLNLSDMGSMGGMGKFGGAGRTNMDGKSNGLDDRGSSNNSAAAKTDEDVTTSSNLNLQGTSSSVSDAVPQNGDAPTKSEGSEGMSPGQSSDGTETPPSDDSESGDSAGNGTRPNRQMPSDDFNFEMSGTDSANSSSTTLIWLAVSILILGAGLLITKLYKY